MSSDAPTHPAGTLAVAHALAEAAASAGNAPSIHDTRPWRWWLTDRTLDLYIDRGRSAADPDRRLATLSCGAALHHARVSLAAQGWHVDLIREPRADDQDHLARVRVTGPAPVDPRAVLDLRTIPLRRTDRRPVIAARVAAGDLAAITTAIAAENTSLHVLRPHQVLNLAVAADQAQRAEGGESAWRAELAYWTGGSGAAEVLDPARPDRLGNLAISADQDRTALFAMLHGRADEPLAWLRAGEALSAGWLTATRLGVSVLPHSAPVEVPSTRQVMRAILAHTGHPYLVLRLGTIAKPDRPQVRVLR